MYKAIFLDRDGVIGKHRTAPRKVEDFEFADGAIEAIRIFKKLGYLVVCVTNQPDISRSKVDAAVVATIHQMIVDKTKITNILTCPHDDEDNCTCRKPKPGLLIWAATGYNIDLTTSYMVGDRKKDIVAGREAGCTTILLDYPDNGVVKADYRCSSLLAFAKKLDNYVDSYLGGVSQVALKLDRHKIGDMIDVLVEIRKNKGRLFLAGVGGGAGNASHAACDFRKIAGIETYAVYDNVSELTARTNDDCWENSIKDYLKGSNFNKKDCLLVFSVGGGTDEVSVNITIAVNYALEKKAKVLGIVGKLDGHTNTHADVCVVVPMTEEALVTPYTESFQSVIWHLLVSHPRLKAHQMKWE
jgi:D-sedoheptulose 7-phosphate isomerase